jgi:hypothetical protein
VALRKTGAELLFKLIPQRYERGETCLRKHLRSQTGDDT